ncbi:MAG: amino acid synthesis family protein [Candidatus Tectomicrobia bacterium]|nr:amino acid synthesis family protein [Candidatus Tectomicrobia bacterium]
MNLCKLVTCVEEIHEDRGVALPRPLRIAIAAAVVPDPLAGKFVDNLNEIVLTYCEQLNLNEIVLTYCEQLGKLLGARAVEALGVPAAEVEAYGKAAIAGLGGDIEHAAVIVSNVRFGGPVRAAAGNGATLLPAVIKLAAPGASFDIPLHHTRDVTFSSHHLSATFSIADAPQAAQIVVAVAVANGGRR